MTPAEELRTAAATLRETAAQATRGPWVWYPTLGERHKDGYAWTITRPWCNKGMPDGCESDCGSNVLTTGAEGCEEDNVGEGDVMWICLTNPLMAEPLAAWLEWAATQDDMNALRAPRHRVDLTEALAVARVINGGTP